MGDVILAGMGWQCSFLSVSWFGLVQIGLVRLGEALGHGGARLGAEGTCFG